MRQIIRDLQGRGVTIFLNSHLLQEVEMICQRVAILDKGQLRYCGPVDSIGEFIQTNSLSVAADSEAPHTNAVGKVVFELLGDLEKIKQCFNVTAGASVAQGAAGKPTTATTPTIDQAAIDTLVDALRAAGVSIVAIQPQRVSLEDAFLTLVDESSFKN